MFFLVFLLTAIAILTAMNRRRSAAAMVTLCLSAGLLAGCGGETDGGDEPGPEASGQPQAQTEAEYIRPEVPEIQFGSYMKNYPAVLRDHAAELVTARIQALYDQWEHTAPGCSISQAWVMEMTDVYIGIPENIPTIYRLQYRLKPEGEGLPTETLTLSDGWITEQTEEGQPYIVCQRHDPQTYTLLGDITEAQLEERFSTPYYRQRYDSIYAAGAFEIRNDFGAQIINQCGTPVNCANGMEICLPPEFSEHTELVTEAGIPSCVLQVYELESSLQGQADMGHRMGELFSLYAFDQAGFREMLEIDIPGVEWLGTDGTTYYCLMCPTDVTFYRSGTPANSDMENFNTMNAKVSDIGRAVALRYELEPIDIHSMFYGPAPIDEQSLIQLASIQAGDISLLEGLDISAAQQLADAIHSVPLKPVEADTSGFTSAGCPLWKVSFFSNVGEPHDYLLEAGLEEDLVRLTISNQYMQMQGWLKNPALYQLLRCSNDRPARVEQALVDAVQPQLEDIAANALGLWHGQPAHYIDYDLVTLLPVDSIQLWGGETVTLCDVDMRLLPEFPLRIEERNDLYVDSQLYVHGLERGGLLAVRQRDGEVTSAAVLAEYGDWKLDNDQALAIIRARLDENDTQLGRAVRLDLATDLGYHGMDHTYFDDPGEDYSHSLILRADRPVTGLRYFTLVPSGDGYAEGETLYTQDTLEPGTPLLLESRYPLEGPCRGFAYTVDGVEQSYIITAHSELFQVYTMPLK